MEINNFSVYKEWKFIYQETIDKVPKKPICTPIIETKELLLKAQVLLGQYEMEKYIDKKEELRKQYNFLKEMYVKLIYGDLN